MQPELDRVKSCRQKGKIRLRICVGKREVKLSVISIKIKLDCSICKDVTKRGGVKSKE